MFFILMVFASGVIDLDWRCEKKSELLAPGRPIRAIGSDTFSATWFELGNIWAVGSWCCEACCECCEHLFSCCEHIFPCCEHLFPCSEYLFPCCEHFFHVAPPPSSLDIVYMLRVMLRVCGEHVASLWQACCDQHPNIVLRTLFPCCEQLFPCCAPSLLPRHSVHIASDVTSLWRACYDHHPNIRCKVVGGWEDVRFFSLVGRLIGSITQKK
jgi:hypothetical protein